METKVKNAIGFTDLKKWLRHRHPMILIDRILDHEPTKYIECLITISGSSDCIAGHFPERAIYPGSNLIQAFSQAGIILFQMGTSLLKDDELTVIGSLNTRFYKVIVPGDSVILRLDVDRVYKNTAFFTGKAFVEGAKVAAFQANIMRLNIADMGNMLW